MSLPPTAQKGKSVRQAWDALVKWAKEAAILPGPGVRLARTANGTVVSFHAPPQVFRGAFKVTLSGESATVGVGTVNGIEPTINGVKIGGDAKNPVPSLRLNASKFDAEGRSWIGVVVKVGKDGKIDAKAKDAAKIAQADHPTREVDGMPFAPLAMLRRADPKGKDFGTLHQIAYFNLNLWQSGGTTSKRRFLFAP